MTAFVPFICYALWLWIKKPRCITINTWISNCSIWFTLYFLIVITIKDLSGWWYATPIIASIILIFIEMLHPHDKSFDI
ncbi:MAG: hypothetical protein NC301_03845 [Bacteroides sp.]|nr:hypothetical protein [Bacteroides sp.]MCM1378679.1 hypothetical protein [Bacteroides sp.]MCM1444952.1 hypothetical protein [Prevotella sp.]